MGESWRYLFIWEDGESWLDGIDVFSIIRVFYLNFKFVVFVIYIELLWSSWY